MPPLLQLQNLLRKGDGGWGKSVFELFFGCVLGHPIAWATHCYLLPDTFWLQASKNVFKVGSVKFTNSMSSLPLWKKYAPEVKQPRAKASHFHAKLKDAETDSKKMFSLLSTLLNRENRSDSLPDMIPQEAAKSFSRFFQEKIQTIRKEFNDDPLDTTENFASSVYSSDLLSSFYALSEDQILKLIRESKSTTVTVDPAPTKLVLEFTDVLLPVFQKIVNLSFTSGTVPTAFKKAVVKPLIKKPNLDPEVLGNYRPVSNLPYLSKILERAVVDQLQAHLDTNGLHVKFQSAYRRGHSTETALLRILNDLLVMIGGGNKAILVLLDLSAAFDTLDHTLLLQRLHAEISLDGSALDWFSSYLSCRSQQVLVGHSLSAETPLLCGVPQGSVLSPLLFSLYTRQLADLIDKFCIDYHFFADDSELYSAYQLNLSLRWVCWVVLSTDKNMDDEKQIETQWAKNWSTPLWAII